MKNNIIVILSLIIISLILFILWDNRNSENPSVKDQTGIHLKLSQNLEINNPAFIKCLDDYINEIGVQNKGRFKFVYLLVISRYISSTATLGLTIIRRKSDLFRYYPIGYFIYKGRNFFICSPLSDFCTKDSNILNAFGDFNKYVYDDITPGADTLTENEGLGVLWHYPSYIYSLYPDSLVKTSGLVPEEPVHETIKFNPPKEINNIP